jgi:hypothetical protein
MKLGDLVQMNTYGVQHGPVGIVISAHPELPDWWIVEWAGTGERETVSENHIRHVY